MSNKMPVFVKMFFKFDTNYYYQAGFCEAVTTEVGFVKVSLIITLSLLKCCYNNCNTLRAATKNIWKFLLSPILAYNIRSISCLG